MSVELGRDDTADGAGNADQASAAGAAPEPIEADPNGKPKAAKGGPSVTLSLSLLVKVLSVVAVVLLVVAGFTTYKWLDARGQLGDATAQVAANATANAAAQENKRAEDIATKYAVGAATVDYTNLGPWQKALVAGTTDQLAGQLKKAAAQMEQLFVPLQWNSTATPVGTVTKSNRDGVIVVNVFISMIIKSTQMPEGLPSTATYSVTVDKSRDWKISDVGGIDQMIGQK